MLKCGMLSQVLDRIFISLGINTLSRQSQQPIIHHHQDLDPPTHFFQGAPIGAKGYLPSPFSLWCFYGLFYWLLFVFFNHTFTD